MSITCIQQTALDYVGGGSDKVYIVQVAEEVTAAGDLLYTAIGYYGRRGSSLSVAKKYAGPNKASAIAAADRLVREKEGKGYSAMSVAAGAPISGMPSGTPVFGGASAAAAASAAATPRRAVSGPLPMLAQVADAARADECLADPNWVAQRKYDGERVMVSLRRGGSGITAYNRKGEVRPLTALAEAELKKLLSRTDFGDERETVLDGELMGDIYVAYDILTLRDNDIRGMSFEERYASLEELLSDNQGLLAPAAWTEAEKRAMLAQAQAEEWEGLVFREATAVYRAGRMACLLKHKLWATCTCRVLTVNALRSVQIALLDEKGVEVFVGNVSVPVNQDIPEPDDLVEVRYLYAGAGGSLYQPLLLGIRTDIDEADKRADLRQAPAEKRVSASTPSPMPLAVLV